MGNMLLNLIKPMLNNKQRKLLENGLAQINQYRQTHDGFRELNKNCFYVAMNMMYSDYYKPTRTNDTYAMLAKDFLTDPDGKTDKLKRYIEVMS